MRIHMYESNRQKNLKLQPEQVNNPMTHELRTQHN